MRNSVVVIMVIASMVFAGTIVQWGDTSIGQMTNFPSGGFFTQIDAGGHHSVALRSNGVCDAWGYNQYGQGTDPGTSMHFTQVDAGGTFNFGIKEDGTLYQWGDESFVIPSVYFTYQYSGISFGNSCGAAFPTDGGLCYWGVLEDPPVMENCTEISAGGGSGTVDEFIAAIDGDSIVVWGEPCMEFPSSEPNENFIHVSAGNSFCVAVRSDGTLFAWGEDSYGQVSGIPGGSNFTEVSAGGYHGIALTAEGTAVAWGRNDKSQCDVPELPVDSVYTQVSAGIYHSIALREYNEPQGVEGGESGVSHIFTADRNPCHGIMSFSVQNTSSVTREIRVYDVSGRVVGTVGVPVGEQSVQWDSGLESGVYAAVLGGVTTFVTVVR